MMSGAGRRARTERCAPDVRRDTKAFALNLLGRRARVLEEAREACEAALRLCAAGLAGAAADVARCACAEAGRALRSVAAKAAAQPRKCTEKIKRCHMERMGVFWAHTMGAENWIRKRKQGKFLRSVMKQLKISNIKNLGRLSKLLLRTCLRSVTSAWKDWRTKRGEPAHKKTPPKEHEAASKKRRLGKESNHRHTALQAAALPTELPSHKNQIITNTGYTGPRAARRPYRAALPRRRTALR